MTGTTPDSLRLSWTVAQGHFASFMIQYKDAQGRPRAVPIKGEERAATIAGLEPGRKYKMALYGLHGRQRVGPVSVVAATGESGLQPQPVRRAEPGIWPRALHTSLHLLFLALVLPTPLPLLSHVLGLPAPPPPPPPPPPPAPPLAWPCFSTCKNSPLSEPSTSLLLPPAHVPSATMFFPGVCAGPSLLIPAWAVSLSFHFCPHPDAPVALFRAGRSEGPEHCPALTCLPCPALPASRGRTP